MNQPKIYLLLYNNAVQFASKDVKCLAVALQRMAMAINQQPGTGYVQITRVLNEKGSYFHSPCVGHSWEIIHRELLYTRRKKRPAVQHCKVDTNNNLTPKSL